tara:strand:- start:7185 stop:8744 length:1560 start_codon:yes stop_codon:yes gene_type:complete
MSIDAERPLVALATLAGFIEVYFTDETGSPIRLSAGQQYACNMIDKGIYSGKYLGAGLEMARGHGKSMIMKAMVVRALLMSYYSKGWGSRYATILTSGTLYQQFSNDIACIVTGVNAPLTVDNNRTPLLFKDFWIRPGIEYPNRRMKEAQTWNIGTRIIYIGDWNHPCRLSVRGMSGGHGDVRGLVVGNQRPDLLVVDDPMKEEEAYNDEITDRVKKFVKNSFIPCGGPNARLAFFGTPFNDKDLITEICGNSEMKPLRGQWPGILSACLPAIHKATKALLCPNLWTVEKLDARFELVGSLAADKEYRLNPRGKDAKIFDEAWIAKWMLPAPKQTPDKRRLKRYMFLDPSLGKNPGSDPSAIVVVDHEPAANIWWVIHADIERRRPQKIVTDYLDLWERFQPDSHASEDVGFQELLVPIFTTEINSRKLPVQATPRLQGTGGVNKVVRITKMSAHVEFGRIRFAADGDHRALRAQLAGYQGKENEKDDGADALEGCVRMAEDGVDQMRAQLKMLNRMGR